MYDNVLHNIQSNNPTAPAASVCQWTKHCASKGRYLYKVLTDGEVSRAGQHHMWHQLCIKIWSTEEFHEDWRKVAIVPINKKQGKLCCDNHNRHQNAVPHSSSHQYHTQQKQKPQSRCCLKVGQVSVHVKYNRTAVCAVTTGWQVHWIQPDSPYPLRGLQEGIRQHLDENETHRLHKESHQACLWDYGKTVSAVCIDRHVMQWFKTLIGVLQKCMMSPLPFNTFLKVVMAHAYQMEEGARMMDRW